jgi:hypothetical protein
MNIRDLTTALLFRSRLANTAGHTYGGKRDLYRALGFQRELQPADYRSRYRRNAVANRIVKAFPLATWRGGEVIEDADAKTDTAFEQAFIDLDTRLKVWDTFKKADVLAGIGRYAIILIGAPGPLDTPLESCSAEEIVYLTPFAEEDATIQSFDIDIKSSRFGMPEYYTVKRTSMKSTDSINTATIGRRVHWTRCLHVADGLLDDRIYGEPRLECVWNDLDNLEKIAGGGAEAFWRRADQGTQFDLDPTLDVSDDQKKALKDQLEEYEHGLRRYILSRGMKVKSLGSDVADIKSNVEAIVTLISTGCGIPQRVLMGSEQGKLAAKQDRANWDNRVTDRQNEYAGPCVVRPFVERLIGFGAIPEPKNPAWHVTFSNISTMDDEQRAEVAKSWASLNNLMADTVVKPNEIRERVLLLPPLDPKDLAAQAALAQENAVATVLEAALESGNTAVIEHLTGVKLLSTSVLRKELRSLGKEAVAKLLED